MKQRIVVTMCSIGLLAVTGCAGPGEVIPIHLHAVPAGAEKMPKPVETLQVAVGDFEDGRSHHTGLGVRTHLWGGVSYFDVPGGKPADAVGQALTEYLTAKGWKVVKQGSSEGSDVVIAGKIEEFVVNAKSRFGFTEITTKTKVGIRASNSSDGSIIRMTLSGAGSEDVFWFEPEAAEGVVNEVLSDSFGKLLQDATIVNRMLRLRNP